MIAENLKKYTSDASKFNACLVAVSKTKPISDIVEAYDAGQRIFGENKVQELVDKQPQLPSDIEWHMIGHLQRNKVKYIAPFVSLIHAVDTLKLLEEIEKQGNKNNRTINCLLQVHIAEEENKFGFSPNEITEIINSEKVKGLKHTKIVGLMGMATNLISENIIRSEFKILKTLFNQVQNTDKPESVNMETLSMGMSNDYLIALEEGSNMIRIGSSIFGQRN